jgi:hypothetical protein
VRWGTLSSAGSSLGSKSLGLISLNHPSSIMHDRAVLAACSCSCAPCAALAAAARLRWRAGRLAVFLREKAGWLFIAQGGVLSQEEVILVSLFRVLTADESLMWMAHATVYGG